MKTTILKEKLKEGIGIVERISAKSLTLPILNNILLIAEKNFLNLISTDLEIGIKWWSLAKTEKEEKIAIPARVFSSFVNLLPNKQVDLEIKDLVLRIECENHQTSIKGYSPDDFPIIPKISTEEKVSVHSKKFCQGLAQIVDVASPSSVKPEIAGVYFLFQKNLITLVATDSFRLGEKKLFLTSPTSGVSKDYSFILPQRAAKEVINIFGEREDELTIYFSPNQVLFETSFKETSHPQIQLISRLIEGDYPNYQEIIPPKYETKVTLASGDFTNQIRLASLFGGKMNEIKLKIDPKKNRLDLSSQSQDVGDYQSFLMGKVEGKACEISFNHRFLLDGLVNLGASQEKNTEIILELAGAEKPGVIKPAGDESYLYLVMPIKAT